MVEDKTKGHRERLRQRLLTGDPRALSDQAVLELLLTYAIPQKDVRPLAEMLLQIFGSLVGVLSADARKLCEVDGLKSSSAALIKLADSIRRRNASGVEPASGLKSVITTQSQQPELFAGRASRIADEKPLMSSNARRHRPRTGLFGKSPLKESVALLPRLPDTDSLDDARAFFVQNLHFSAEQTRQRRTRYIVHSMFPGGVADGALRLFAKKYGSNQELRDVCFYRFCKSEPLVVEVMRDVVLPSVGSGQLSRKRLLDYLAGRFGGMKSIKDCSQAIVEALTGAGIATSDRKTVRFGYREVLLPSFTFILHSEFIEPGMYDIAKIENNCLVKAMLWNPSKILHTLYELRNQGIISKISEIDTVRQFTTRWTLDQVVQNLRVATKGQ